MLKIKKNFVTDNNNKPIAVQVDIRTYKKMEQLLEDYALGKYIEENDPGDYVSVSEAKDIYTALTGKKE